MKPGMAPMTSDLSPVDRLGEINAREYPLYVALDVGWLLEHIEQLQRDLAEAEAVVSDVTEQLTGRALMAAQLAQLRAQRQAVIDLCAMNMAVDDGSASDVDMIWPSQVTNLLDISDAEITASSRLAFPDDD